jgi:hypothetical protein
MNAITSVVAFGDRRANRAADWSIEKPFEGTRSRIHGVVRRDELTLPLL